MVTALRSRLRVANRDEGARKPNGDDRTLLRYGYQPEGIWRVNRHPVPARGPFTARQSLVNRAVTEAKSEAQEGHGEGL